MPVRGEVTPRRFGRDNGRFRLAASKVWGYVAV